MTPPARERFIALAQRFAEEVAALELDLPARETMIAGDVQVVVNVIPARRVAWDDLKECQRDILLTLFEAHPRRLTGEALMAAMVRSGRLHGLGTMNVQAPRLLQFGLASNPHDRRGYGITAAGLELVEGQQRRSTG